MACLSQSSRAQLVGLGEGAALFNFLTDSSAAYEQEFIEIEAYRPDVNWRVAVSGAPLEVLSERHYDAARALCRSDAYEEHVRKWGGLYGCQTVLVRDSDRLIGLATLRDESDGKTSKRDRTLFAAAAQSAQTAVRMQRAIADQGRALLLGTLDALDAAVFLLDRMERVVGMSEKAEAIIRDQNATLTLRNRRISAARRDCDTRLQAAMGATLAGVQTRRLWLKSSSGSGQLCELFRLPQRAWDLSFDPRMMIVVRDATDISSRQLEPLRAALDLTGAEAEIALALANGTARDRVAQLRGTSTQTLNTQIKSILHKGGVSREAELVALINRLLR
jgi:DNA-binding CsgD family transcriptional regulator